MLNQFYQKIQDYCETYSSNKDEDLYKLERETYLKTLSPNMLTGHLQAMFIQVLVQISGVQRVLEIGTFTGYTTLAIAKVLPDSGSIDSMEVNRELEYFHDKYLSSDPMKSKVNIIWGDAVTNIKSLSPSYDLIYIDAGKMQYSTYFEESIRLVKSGGIILTDNVLWSGKVAFGNIDKDTQAIHAFNNAVKKDRRIQSTIILPIRDGLSLTIKK